MLPTSHSVTSEPRQQYEEEYLPGQQYDATHVAGPGNVQTSKMAHIEYHAQALAALLSGRDDRDQVLALVAAQSQQTLAPEQQGIRKGDRVPLPGRTVRLLDPLEPIATDSGGAPAACTAANTASNIVGKRVCPIWANGYLGILRISDETSKFGPETDPVWASHW